MRALVIALLVAAALCSAAAFAASAGRAASPAPSPARALAAASNTKLPDYFTPDEITRSRRYNGPRTLVGLASLVIGLAVAGVLGLGRPSRSLGAWAEKITGGRWPLTVALLAAIVIVVPTIVTLPISIWRDLYHERAFSLSRQTLGGFLADEGKGLVFQIVLTAAAALGFYFIVRKLPRSWPAVAAAFMVALTFLLVIVYPLVYEPLFNKFTPVDQATRDRIVAIADKTGVKVDRVLVADGSRRTTKLNAYVSGLGATKRVVLYDTLLQHSTPQQTDLVVAHELGHVVHKDVWRGTLLGAAGAAGAVMVVWFLMSRAGIRVLTGATGAGDPKSLPFLVFVLAVASVVTLPVANGFSRHIEAAADRFAVHLTHDPQTAVQTEVVLARTNISDLEPNKVIEAIFFTHPATMERIQNAIDEGSR